MVSELVILAQKGNNIAQQKTVLYLAVASSDNPSADKAKFYFLPLYGACVVDFLPLMSKNCQFEEFSVRNLL